MKEIRVGNGFDVHKLCVGKKIKLCGVEIKNDNVAPFDAPRLCMDVATGMTPHEHKGIGTPKSDAFETEAKPGFPKLFATISFDVKIYRTPETKNPSIR